MKEYNCDYFIFLKYWKKENIPCILIENGEWYSCVIMTYKIDESNSMAHSRKDIVYHVFDEYGERVLVTGSYYDAVCNSKFKKK